MTRRRILIVDDEQSMREMLAILLKKEGFDVVHRGQPRARRRTRWRRRAGRPRAHRRAGCPDGDGLEILRHVKAASPETAVVVMTAYGTTETAVAARKLGAEAYILKPFDVDELRIVVRDALANRELREENVRLKREVGQRLRPRPADRRLAGHGRRSSRWCARSRRPAPPCSSPARAAPARSSWRAPSTGSPARADGPFVSDQLRGPARHAARERAVRPREGRLHRRAAEQEGALRGGARGHALPRRGGGDLARRCRSSCCARCRSGGSGRVGGTEEIDVDVRVIAATNVPLEDARASRSASARTSSTACR